MSIPIEDDKELESSSSVSPIVTFMVRNTVYGVSTTLVQGMLEMPEIRPVPHAPSCVRGLINLRGEVLPVVDLRVRLGMPSKVQECSEFVELMKAREKDHILWLEELDASVAEGRPFNLATDPTQCAFGRWYQTFETDDQVARSILARMEGPHEKIHATAQQVAEKVAAGDTKAAQEILERVRDTELSRLLELFQSIRKHYGDDIREQAIILEAPAFTYAIAVDSIESVEFLDDRYGQENPQGLGDKNLLAVVGLGRRQNSQDVIQLLTAGSITEGVDMLAMI
jgi:chemotaxis signal transduction protein